MWKKWCSADSVGYNINLAVLLLVLVLALIVAPLFEKRAFGALLLYGFLTALLLAGGGFSFARRRLFLVALILILLAIPVTWINAFQESQLLFVATCLLYGVFSLFIATILLRNVMLRYLATWQSVFGSLAAYLLIGLAWAMLYWATEGIEGEQIVFSEARKVPFGSGGQQVTAFSQMVYFSFVTMSTLGYGDVTPRTPMVRSFAWMQAVAGQFYIAVLVARLVAEVRLSVGDKSLEDKAGDG